MSSVGTPVGRPGTGTGVDHMPPTSLAYTTLFPPVATIAR